MGRTCLACWLGQLAERGFGVDVGEHIGEREKADVTQFPPQAHKRPVLVWCCEVFWQAKAAVKSPL